jgi:hypothetical protein
MTSFSLMWKTRTAACHRSVPIREAHARLDPITHCQLYKCIMHITKALKGHIAMVRWYWCLANKCGRRGVRWLAVSFGLRSDKYEETPIMLRQSAVEV